jgi:multifunctional methyltransferase subunit TRM112
MKLLTANFLTCAVKACKSSPLSFPLHFRDAELETTDMDYNPTFLHNILPRLEWDALRTTAAEVGLVSLLRVGCIGDFACRRTLPSLMGSLLMAC